MSAEDTRLSANPQENALLQPRLSGGFAASVGGSGAGQIEGPNYGSPQTLRLECPAARGTRRAAMPAGATRRAQSVPPGTPEQTENCQCAG